MLIPKYVEKGFRDLLGQLETLLKAQSALPDNVEKIPNPNEFSEDSKERDICLAQRYYALASLAVSEIFPVIQNLDKKDGTFKNIIQAGTGIGFTTFTVKDYLSTLNIAGKLSYYAASMFVATLLDIKAGFDADHDPERTEQDAAAAEKALETFGLGPKALLAEKIRLFKAYAYSGRDDNAYQACEKLCQEFTEIAKKTHQANENLDSAIQDSLTNIYKTTFGPSEEERNKHVTMIEREEKNLALIETEITELETQLNKLAPDIKALPPKILKVAQDSDEYHLEDAPPLASLQNDLIWMKSKIATEIKKLTALAKQIENEKHFKRVCTAIEKETILPIQEWLNTLVPSATYSADLYSRFLIELTRLEKIDFPDHAKKGLPYPDPTAGAENIFADVLNEKIASIKESLKAKITLQEQLFNETLTAVLEKQKELFEANCKEKLSEANTRLQKNLSNAPEETLDEEEKFYNDYMDQLTDGLRFEKVVYRWAEENNLSDSSVTQKLTAGFLAGETYQKFLTDFTALATPLEHVLQQGQLKVETASTAKIQQFEAKANKLTKDIVAYEAALKQIRHTIEQDQTAYNTQKAELDKLTHELATLFQEGKELIKALVPETTFQQEPASVDELSQILNDDSIHLSINQALESLQEKKAASEKEALQTSTDYLGSLANEKALEDLKSPIMDAFQTEKKKGVFEKATTRGDSFDKILQHRHKELFEEPQWAELIRLLKNQKTLFDSSDADEKSCQNLLDEQIAEQKQKTTLAERRASSAKETASDISNKITTHSEKHQKLKTLDSQLKITLPKTMQAETSLQELAKQQAKALQTAYQQLDTYLPKETAIAPGQAHQTHSDNLESTKIDLTLLQIKLSLINRKKNLFKLNDDAKNLKSHIEKLTITPATFQCEAGTKNAFHTQWQEHEKKQQATFAALQTALSTTEKDLLPLEKNALSLADQLTPIEQLLKTQKSTSPEQTKELTTLVNAKNAIANELTALRQQKMALQTQYEEKKAALAIQKAIFHEEKNIKQNRQKVLREADTCLTQMKNREELLEKHRYDAALIQQLTQGETPADFITRKDNFYISSASKLDVFRTTVNNFHNHLIIDEAVSDLDKSFNQALKEKIAALEEQLRELTDTNTQHLNAWQKLSNENKVIRNSREVIKNNKARKPLDANLDYTDYDLRGIQLDKQNFKGIPIENADLSNATLTNCTFSGPLNGVNFENADVSSCNFDGARFPHAKVNQETLIDWEIYGYDILRDNLANPHLNSDRETYLTDLITLVHQKKEGGIPGTWVLNMLEEIAAVKRPDDIDETIHLQKQRQRAEFFMEQIVPKLGFKALLEVGYQLVVAKHSRNNPYKFLFDSTGGFCINDDTDASEKIITLIQTRLDTVATRRISANQKIWPKQYEQFMTVMKANVHTHLLDRIGFFLSPKLPAKWEQKENELVAGNEAAKKPLDPSSST